MSLDFVNLNKQQSRNIQNVSQFKQIQSHQSQSKKNQFLNQTFDVYNSHDYEADSSYSNLTFIQQIENGSNFSTFSFQPQLEYQGNSSSDENKSKEQTDISDKSRQKKNEKNYPIHKGYNRKVVSILKNKEMNAYIFRKRDFSMTNIPHLLQPFKKFYLFVDQLIDMDYLKSIASGDDEQYLKEDLDVSIFKGIKFVNEVKHRMDNKCIEVNSEYVDIFQNDIKPLVAYISSLGNKDLHELAQSLEIYWSQYVLQFQQQIKMQSEDRQFKIHQVRRQMEAEKEFIERTRNIDQTKFICYFYYKTNYSKYQFHSCRVGYTSCFYELLSENSYKFIDNLQKKGYYDPFSRRYRLKECLNRSKEYIKSVINLSKPNKENQFSPTEISTMDSLVSQALFSSNRVNLNQKYDTENHLQFKINDLLVFNEFIFEEENILEDLKEIRKNQQDKQQSNISESDAICSEIFFNQTEFYDKYYSDQVQNLEMKGNKWNKRCGFIGISKKRKSK